MNLLSLIGYQYSSDVVLTSACILTNLSVDPQQLPMASTGVDNVRHELRRDFADAICTESEVEYRMRPSWVVLNLLLRQVRVWHTRRDVTRPALVHVLLGWPATQNLSFEPNSAGTYGQLWRPDGLGIHASALQVKQHRVAESGDGIIAEVFHRLDPQVSMSDVDEYWRETELCWEILRILRVLPRHFERSVCLLQLR